jgi:ElaB/YqjD/DUF883 family membrane-anchored ribosome-binding protein
MAKMTDETRHQRADDLAEIQAEMIDLLDRARTLLRGTGMAKEQAEAYWLAQVETALSDDHDYLGGSTVTMADTIRELRGEDEEGEDGEEDDD